MGSLLSGHQLATAAMFVQIVTYFVIGILSAPHAAALYRWMTPLSEHQPAALFYLLLLLALFTWAGSGAAFILDIIRVPVLTSAW